MSLLPEQKTKKELQAEREKTERIRKEAEDMRDQLLKLQVGHMPAKISQKSIGVKNDKKSMSEMAAGMSMQRNERPGSSQSNMSNKGAIQKGQIQFSGPNGDQIKQGQTKPIRISSARPILNRSNFQNDIKTIKISQKKPAPILKQNKTNNENKQLQQQYQMLYQRAMKGLGFNNPNLLINNEADINSFQNSSEYKGVQEVLKNFTATSEVASGASIATHGVQDQQAAGASSAGDYEGCDIFAGDDAVNHSGKHDCSCGGDAPWDAPGLAGGAGVVQASLVASGAASVSVSTHKTALTGNQASSSATWTEATGSSPDEAPQSIALNNVQVSGVSEAQQATGQARGCETERVELSPRTRGILDGLARRATQWRPGSADPERRRRLIERVLAEDGEDDIGITVEDIVEELERR